MSSYQPTGPDEPTGAGSPEYLGAGGTEQSRPKRRGPLLAVAALGVVAVVGVGGWGALALMGGGNQPADAVPADAVGYVSLDLDPSAEQKIEAVRILKRFPGLEKELDLEAKDDLRRLMFEQIQADGTCTDLAYGDDVAPWIGDRVALAVVPGDGEDAGPTPVLALQVTDEDAARTGLEKLSTCEDNTGGSGDASEGDAEGGFAFVGDYAVVSDTQKHADALAAAAEDASLADDADFQKWTDAVGDPGIVTVYASAEAPEVLAELSESGDAWFDYAPSGTTARLQAGSGTDPMREMQELYADFEGMAGVVRFEDGAMDVEVAGKGMPAGVSQKAAGPSLSDLPGTTAAAFTVGLEDGWLGTWLDSMSGVFGPGMSTEEMLREAEAQTGLALPEDVEALLGDGFSISIDGDADVQALMQADDPTKVPVGVRVSGDPAEVTAAVDKVKATLGPGADLLRVEQAEGLVALGLDPAYVGRLVEEGALGDEVAFQEVLPEADEATSAFYLSFDAVEKLATDFTEAVGVSGPDELTIQENLAPLDALGASSWVDSDDVVRARFRVTTD